MAAVVKGVVMRKALAPILIGTLLIVALLVAVATAGCGTAGESNAATPTTAVTPEALLTQAAASMANVQSGTGDFSLTVSVNADQSKLPAEAQAFLGKPITVSGTLAFSEDPQAADATVNASLAGQDMAFGIKAVDDKAWIQFMGQWYELPADMMQQATGSTGTTSKAPDMAAMMQALTAAGVDPKLWLTGLTIVGEDAIDGTPAYHLAGTVNMNQIMTDAIKLTQDKTIMGMMSTLGGGTDGSTASSIPVPSQQELQQMQTQLSSMFKNVSVDMWIAKDSYQLRKMDMNASIVPPAGEDSQGINSIDLKATASLAPSSTPLTVTPPTGAKPFSELEKDLGGFMNLFSGALGGGILGQ
jgi:hypothetical protein